MCIDVYVCIFVCMCECVLCAYAYMYALMCVFDLPLLVESLFLIGQSKAICNSIHSKHVKTDNLYGSTLAVGFNNKNLT